MVAGFATKLEMEATGGGALDEPPQPISPPKHKLSAKAHATGARIRFIVFPVYSKVGRISSFTSYDSTLTFWALATAVPQLLCPDPQPPSGFYIKEKPPCKTPEMARELWNRSEFRGLRVGNSVESPASQPFFFRMKLAPDRRFLGSHSIDSSRRSTTPESSWPKPPRNASYAPLETSSAACACPATSLSATATPCSPASLRAHRASPISPLAQTALPPSPAWRRWAQR